MTQRPSGWYDDPGVPDQLRYWDGILWTDRTMPKVKPGLERSHIGDRQPEVEHRHHLGQVAQPVRRDVGDQGHGWAPSHPYQPLPVRATPDGEPVSGWWRRAAAFLIDGLLVMVVAFVLCLPWLQDWLDAFRGWWDASMAAARAGDSAPAMPDAVAQIPWQLQVADIALYAVYEILMTTRVGRTVGKMVTGIRVRQADSPKNPTLNQSALRFLVKQIANIVAFIPVLATMAALFAILDYVFPLLNPGRQALHDKAASTYVVRRR